MFKSIQKDSKSIKTDRILIRVFFSTYKTLFGSVGTFWNYASKYVDGSGIRVGKIGYFAHFFVDKVRVDMMCDNSMDFQNGFVR